MVVEAAVGIGSGLLAQSLVLVAFGLDSVIALASAAVLLCRLHLKLRDGRSFAEHAERTASRIGRALLFFLAAFLVAAACWKLRTQQGAAFSLLVLLPASLQSNRHFWSRRKLVIAQQLGSRALRADAIESVTCGWLASVAVWALVAQLLLGVWWVDAIGSLAIRWLLIQEVREAWEAEGSCGD